MTDQDRYLHEALRARTAAASARDVWTRTTLIAIAECWEELAAKAGAPACATILPFRRAGETRPQLH